MKQKDVMTELKGQRTKGSIHCGYGSGGDGKSRWLGAAEVMVSKADHSISQ